MAETDVSIIYVNWNCSGEMLGSIDSVRALAKGCACEIIVVDNNSSENLAPLEQPGIRLIRSPRNGGFGAGCNLGAQAAAGKYLLFLNPDTILQNDAPDILFRFMEDHPGTGACGPTVLNDDGSVSYGAGRRCLSLINDILEHTSLCFRFPRVPFIGRPYYGNWDHRSTREVECLVGACMMFRKNAFRDLGGFDEQFFLYCEEVDVCRRTLRSGYAIHYVHTARVMHECRKSTMQYYGTYHKIVMQYLKSCHIYFRKNSGRIHARIWRCCIGLIYAAKYLRRRRPEDREIAGWGFSRV
ncbi:MAG: glycosyltransferase family 2 protein [Planctomycetota bacterium]|jgi:GT2 family glycosyltransferase|nr:glycosyltransferase family 2 protein [Planctomycetota bacterium]